MHYLVVRSFGDNFNAILLASNTQGGVFFTFLAGTAPVVVSG